MGTKIINRSGDYKLCEDIVFHPNGPRSGQLPAEDAFDPDFDVYDPNNYGLGFFAAIAITVPDVNLYLNCKTIKQSAGHALFQRFFAVIELANSPFLPKVGPANFVNEDSDFRGASQFKAARNVLIKGPGTIGRSSHHGIHGNNNRKVEVRDVKFTDFEVAAIALNNVDNALIENCDIRRNRQDVPILGSFSAARNIRPYAKKLAEMGYTMDIAGVKTNAADLYEDLMDSINKVYEDVVIRRRETGGFIDPATSPNEHYLFDNPFRVVDGPCYTFVIHGHGPAVGGYGFALEPDDTLTSSNIRIIDNQVRNIKCWTNEIPAAVINNNVQNDARGAILQFVSSIDNKPLAINPDGTYRRNVVADLQIMVADALNSTLPATDTNLQSVSTIDEKIVQWASTEGATFTPEYRCNGDSMHHVSKGMVMLRMEDTNGFLIENNLFRKIENLSTPAFGTDFGSCTTYHAGASLENLEDQQGANVRVISISAVAGFPSGGLSRVVNNKITHVGSFNAELVVGIDVQGESEDMKINKNLINLQQGVGEDTNDNLIAMRIREFVDDTTVVVGNGNVFKQETQVLNRRRLGKEKRRAMLLEAHKNLNKNEWQMGGCPFARRQ